MQPKFAGMLIKFFSMFFSKMKSLSKRKPMPCNLFFTIFDSKGCPIFLFGAEIWGLGVVNEIETVHLSTCKQF